MNIRRLQGLALIVSAVCLPLAAFFPQTIILTIGIILFILGIPAVYSAQPTGWIGLAGIVLLELAALISLGFRLHMVPPSSLGDSLSLTSAILGMLGAVIIGWLTTRGNVFPAWVGWLFMAQGLLNFITGLFNIGAPGRSFLILIPILQTVATFAYGYFIYQFQ